MTIEFISGPQLEGMSSISCLKAQYNPRLIHQVVTSYMSAGRSGAKKQKTRGEVSCSTKKMWRQKGTGRARVGAASNPLWRSGGVIFAARPRDFNPKINRKMYRGAMRSILSQLLAEGRLKVIDKLELPTHKTRDLRNILSGMGISKVLLVDNEISREVDLATRNLPNVSALPSTLLSPYAVVKAPCVVFTKRALEHFEEQLVC